MRAFTRVLLANRTIVIGLLVIYFFAGVVAFKELPIEAYPDVTNVQAQIITLWPGHASEEVEKFVTIAVENQMNGIPDLASIRSISLFGLSVVTVTFEDGADDYRSRNLMSQQMAQINFPPGATPSLSSDSTAVGEIYRYTLQAPPGFPDTELKAIDTFVVQRQLRTVPGVVDVNGFGGPTKQYQALVDPVKLKSYGLTLQSVTQALANSNQNAGGAYIEHGPQLLIVRGLGLIRNLDDIRSTVLGVRNNIPITVGDVAAVQIGHQLRLGRVGLNKPRPGKSPAVTDQDDVIEGIVDMRTGENVLAVLKRVEAKAAQINKTYLPPGVHLVPHYDRTELIDRTLHTVRHNTITGIVLVLLVLVAFLGLQNWRAALLVASVIPFSLLGAFMLLDYLRIPANLISMGAVDFGIIVDASVVVMEIIIQLLEHRRQNRLSLAGAIVEGVGQMGKPILFSKLVLLTAFLPLYTLQRVEGRIFHPMALTLSFAIVVGVVLALTAVPCLASLFLRVRDLHAADEPMTDEPAAGVPADEEPTGLAGFFHRRYIPLLDFCLRRRGVVLVAALGVLGLTALVGRRLGSEFLPKLEEGALWLHMTMPEATAPSEAAKLTRQAREILASYPEVKTVVSQIGRPDDGTDVGGFNDVEIYVELLPPDQWKTAHSREALTAKMNARLTALPGVDYEFSQYIEDNVNEAVSGIKGELGIKIFGPDPDKLQALADQICELVRAVPGTVDVSPEHLLGQPQVQVQVNRQSVARYGLAIGDVNGLVDNAFGGSVATQVLEGERNFDLAVKLRPELIENLDAIRAIPLFGSNNEIITLGQVADVGIHNGFARIYREENERRIAAKFSVRNRDLGSVVAEAQGKVDAQVKLPAGYRLEWTGSFENQQRATRRLLVVVPITLAVIFFILFAAFNSARSALLVLVNVPLAAFGGVAGLFLAGLPLSVSALAGFVALFGIAIEYCVIMITRIHELAAEGLAVDPAIREGALSRLRAVLMTSIMAALGLLPAALSHAVGSETARPFATVIVGGLVSSTLLTLFVFPVVCTFFLRGTQPPAADAALPPVAKEPALA